MILLEHLLTHGPESSAEEFQIDKDVIKEMESFQHIDEKGYLSLPLSLTHTLSPSPPKTCIKVMFVTHIIHRIFYYCRFNWGLAVRKKSERVSKLLEKGSLLKEERDRARKLTREIQGFGSFSARSTSGQGILREASFGTYGRRCNSNFNDRENLEDQYSNDENLSKTGSDLLQNINEDQVLVSGKQMENSNFSGSYRDAQKLVILDTKETSLKENMAPTEAVVGNKTGESKPLLGDQKDKPRVEISTEEDHPFNDSENQATSTLLSTRG